MKKAKIMLTAIAIFAVVGGALAFNTARNSRVLYIPNEDGACLVTTVTFLKTTASGIGFQAQYSTTTTNVGCPTWVTTTP
jgi:hypothetical protein